MTATAEFEAGGKGRKRSYKESPQQFKI